MTAPPPVLRRHQRRRATGRTAAQQSSAVAGPKVRPNLVADARAGVVVFLVALPLCLGVALASGAPLLAGVVTGVVGGLLVSMLSGSQLMVSGPAAGLTAIVFAGIQQVGFAGFLATLVLAGVLQAALGAARAGIVAYFFPSSVIKGMLAAIGLILVSKQLPYALGVGVKESESTGFVNTDGGTTASVIGDALAHVHFGALAVAAISLGALVLWQRPAMARVKAAVPGPLAAVLLAVGANALFGLVAPALAIPGSGLVSLPVPERWSEWAGLLERPDFSVLGTRAAWTLAATLAIVASIETLLSLEATDRLDPLKRTAPANRELLAQGVGNVVAGLVGGLPMTGVIVRSSANIDAGARTRWASFTHGALLLLAVLLVPAVLNHIPLAALAAVLIFTGGKLARPSLVRATWRQGFKQFAPFAVTVVAILATDLLVGIGIGMAVGAFFILYDNYRTPYFYHREESADHRDVRISLSEDVTFLNKASIRQLFDEVPAGRRLTIDGTMAVHIDPDVLEIIHGYRETAAERGVELTLVHVPDAPAGAAAH